MPCVNKAPVISVCTVNHYLDQGLALTPTFLDNLEFDEKLDKIKKKISFVTEWQKLTPELSIARFRDNKVRKKGFALLTGKVNGFMVLDIDNMVDFQILLFLRGLDMELFPSKRHVLNQGPIGFISTFAMTRE